ncbi:MAG: D-alanyl-D-alanine carboxypeptidase [Clostridiaceae bacterium]|nr:D-alanyl-D-alanine carboxypeptidase [Clostridiaceae bacterium]
MRKFLSCFFLIVILIFILTTFSNAFVDNSFIWSGDYVIETSTSSDVDLQFESASAILIEQNSGKILYEHNSHEQLRPASVTKVMSILLIMEALDSGKISLDDKVPCSEQAANMGGSQIWLDVREELTVNEMLKAICVASANDCTVAMAEYLAGSQEAFVEKMNIRAKELGMNDTCFKNCHGLDTDGHVTSSYDISLMSRELLKNHPSITNYTTIWMDTLRDGKSELVNTNKLIRNYKGATGLKTGSTDLALYNLSASATRDNLSLIAVIMKSPSTKIRFSEAQKLLDYGFSNYSYVSFAKKDTILKNINISKGVNPFVNLVYECDSGALLKKGAENEIEQIVNIYDNIKAPISKGQKLGEINYLLNGENIGNTALVSDIEIKKITLSNMYEHILFDWFYLLR